MTKFLNTDLDVTLGGLTPSDEKVSSQKATKTYIDAQNAKKVDKTIQAQKVYGTDENGNQTVYDYTDFGQVNDVKVGEVSVVVNKIATLGTAASHNANEFQSAGDYALKSEIPTVPTNVSAFTNDSGYITKSVNNLDNYTTTASLNGLLANKQNKLVAGANIIIDESTDTISASSQIILDYNDLENKPSINSVELSGNKTLADLGIQPSGNYAIDTDVVHKTGDETINGTKTFTSNINGTATSALWADLAEYYEADQAYEPGTLLQVGGEKEITIATTEVNLIVSTKPGFILNHNHDNSENWLLCCLSGRIPVLVDGSVKKGDRLYLSKEQPGKASTTVNGNAIAIALEDGDKLVNAISKLTF